MATTTDTLIFELKVKDDASKTFDAWDKKLADLEKQFKATAAEASKSASKIAESAKKAFAMVTDVREFINGVKDGTKALLLMDVNFKKIAATAKAVGAAIKAVFSALGGFILAPFQMAWDFMTGFFSFMKDGFKNAVKFVKDFAVDATKNFLKYEDALLVVSRTTGETWENTKKLGATLLDMALSVGKFAAGGEFEEMGLQAGIAANKLAEIAGIAGQLGKSGDELVGFVNVVAKMSVATDLSASSAATLLATLGNLFNLSTEGIERIASVINELGNTTIATQSQIGEMMRRMGGTAAFLGLSADQVAAYAATMREAGVTVRVGGTAMSQFMTKLMTDGSKMAASLGLDWQTMKATLESNDPSPAIELVLNKINELAQSGGRITVAEKLRDIGITGIGLQDTLLKLSQNTDLLTKNLEAAKEEWAENDSLAAEYAKTLETAGHKFDVMYSFIDAIKKVIGEDLAQAFGDFTENYLTPLVTKFLEWVKSPAVQKFLEETLPKALEWVGEKIELLSEFFTEFMENVGEVGPWEALKTAISGVWSNLKDIISGTWDTISNSIDGKIGDIKQSLKAAWEEMKATASAVFWEISDTIIEAMSNIGETIGDVFGGEAQTAWEDFTSFISEIPHMIQAVSDELSNLMPSINEIVDGMVSAVNTFKDIKGGLENFELDIGGGLATSAKAVFDLGKDVLGFTDGTTKAVKNTGKAIDDMTASTKAAEDASKALANTNYGNSTYPDTTEWVNKTSRAITGMASKTNVAESASRSLGSEAVASLNQMATAYENLNQHVNRYNPPTTIANAGYSAPSIQDIASSGSQSAQQSTSEAAPSESRASSIGQPTTTTVINFSGTNIVDESSKERFVRQITQAQSGLSSTSVRAA